MSGIINTCSKLPNIKLRYLVVLNYSTNSIRILVDSYVMFVLNILQMHPFEIDESRHLNIEYAGVAHLYEYYPFTD